MVERSPSLLLRSLRTAATRFRAAANAGADVSVGDLVSVDPSGPEVAADWGALNTPETYLGYRKTENLASPGGMDRDVPKAYNAPGHVRHNH